MAVVLYAPIVEPPLRGPARRPQVVLVVDRPIQHFAESFRQIARSQRIGFTVLYWSDNREGLFDPEFDRHVTWDVDLLSGYAWELVPGRKGLEKARRFANLLRGLAPDVVVCFGWGSPIARLAILSCMRNRTPLLFYGDTSWQHSGNGPRAQLRRLALGMAFRFAAGALSSGAFNREFYIHHGMHPALIVDSVYPIDVSSYAAVRHKRVRERRPVVIGFAGKLIPRKGVDELLRALKLIGDDEAWEGRVIGDGEERGRLEALAEHLGIAHRIKFRGFRNASEMPGELVECDIVVVPSTRDNRGMIAAEAMATGAAVIVSSNTGVWGRGDLIEDGVTGRVYRSGAPHELAAILRDLIDSPAGLATLQDAGELRARLHGPSAFTIAMERAAEAIAESRR